MGPGSVILDPEPWGGTQERDTGVGPLSRILRCKYVVGHWGETLWWDPVVKPKSETLGWDPGVGSWDAILQ